MSIIGKIYDEKTRTDKVWYESSNVVFSKFVENEHNNLGQLYVTFKNGATYHYKDVDMPTDYLLFKSGGIDNSQGKTLNKQIKGKYEYERVSDEDVNLLMEELERVNNGEYEEGAEDSVLTYFISGHREITQEEFDAIYVPVINRVLEGAPDCRFVIGDYWGADEMAQNYLLDVLELDPERVTVYHMLEKPRYFNSKVVNFRGGFPTDDARDEAMTEDSNEDIAFVRDPNVLSGTAKNILRRYRYPDLESE
jgi:hypothetical protein